MPHIVRVKSARLLLPTFPVILMSCATPKLASQQPHAAISAQLLCKCKFYSLWSRQKHSILLLHLHSLDMTTGAHTSLSRNAYITHFHHTKQHNITYTRSLPLAYICKKLREHAFCRAKQLGKQ